MAFRTSLAASIKASASEVLALGSSRWPFTRSRRLGIAIHLPIEVGDFGSCGMITLLVFQDTEPVAHGFPVDNTIPEERLHEMEVTILGNEILGFFGFLHTRVG